ncbi:MAG TPA: ABC-2 family transporter protein [Candidatus Saccharimonadales bacterium]|nr:ABC-2 family transporter protein [Candidatus Saccharimonadales bacterium]
MRYVRIFLLHTQEVFEERSRLTVWFLLSWITPLVLILFWRGAKNLGGWTIQEIASYYLLVITMGVFLMSHHEEIIAIRDIQEGGLTAYLLKPFSYFWIRFFSEISYRFVQGAIGFLIFFLLIQFFPSYFVFTRSPLILILSIVIILLSLFLVFVFKSIMGILAFWLTDARGAFEAMGVILMMFAGYLMPLAFFPMWIQSFVYYLPFPYMIYFPVIAFEGKLTDVQLFKVIGVEIVWIVTFCILFKKMWHRGVKKYTGIGQ